MNREKGKTVYAQNLEEQVLRQQDDLIVAQDRTIEVQDKTIGRLRALLEDHVARIEQLDKTLLKRDATPYSAYCLQQNGAADPLGYLLDKYDFAREKTEAPPVSRREKVRYGVLGSVAGAALALLCVSGYNHFSTTSPEQKKPAIAAAPEQTPPPKAAASGKANGEQQKQQAPLQPSLISAFGYDFGNIRAEQMEKGLYLPVLPVRLTVNKSVKECLVGWDNGEKKKISRLGEQTDLSILLVLTPQKNQPEYGTKVAVAECEASGKPEEKKSFSIEFKPLEFRGVLASYQFGKDPELSFTVEPKDTPLPAANFEYSSGNELALSFNGNRVERSMPYDDNTDNCLGAVCQKDYTLNVIAVPKDKKGPLCLGVKAFTVIKEKHSSATPRRKRRGETEGAAANCTAGDPRCSGSKLEYCANDGKTWKELMNCPNGCDAEKKKCNEITGGDTTPKTFSCTGDLQQYASLCPDDKDGLREPTRNSSVASLNACTDKKCEHYCTGKNVVFKDGKCVYINPTPGTAGQPGSPAPTGEIKK